MKRFCKIALFISLLICPRLGAAQDTASFGVLVTSLSTTSTGAVSGTSFALPGLSAAIVTWQVTYTGAPNPVSVKLEASLDNTTWFTVGTSTVITGDLQTTIHLAVKFIRISQVSKTGAGTTTGTLVAQHSLSLVPLTAGFNNGTVSLPSIFSATTPTSGFYFPTSSSIGSTVPISFNAILFSNLGTPTNGTILYCSDCAIANPCTGSSTGAFAKR